MDRSLCKQIREAAGLIASIDSPSLVFIPTKVAVRALVNNRMLAVRVCRKKTLRFLCVLGVSAVKHFWPEAHRRDAEYAKVTQRKQSNTSRRSRVGGTLHFDGAQIILPVLST